MDVETGGWRVDASEWIVREWVESGVGCRGYCAGDEEWDGRRVGDLQESEVCLVGC